MISVSRNPILTKLFVVLLALAFVLAPVASAQHCGSVTGVDCTYEHAVEPDESEDHATHSRDHAHGCSSCHAHMIACEVEVRAGGLAFAKPVPEHVEDLVRPRPDGLFRPPRA